VLENRIADLESQLIPGLHQKLPHEEDDITDGLHALNLRTQKSEFYGPSSSQYFFDRLCVKSRLVTEAPSTPRAALGGSSAADEGRVVHEPTLPEEGDIATGNGFDADTFSPPFSIPKHDADDLLNTFWEEIAPLWPIFDEKEFWWAYNLMWEPSKQTHRNRQEREWDVVLVNSVFALVCQQRTMKSKEGDNGLEYFDRANKGLGYIHGNANFGTVRSLLLMVSSTFVLSNAQAIWLRNATRLNEAYNFLGSAIRSAHGIGLHRETRHSRLMPLYIDLRRRTWWCLYCLDVKISIEMGRPLACQAWDINISLPSPQKVRRTLPQ
jgi:hypothetical protein